MNQAELFSLPQQLPSGLSYVPDFLSAAEEQYLLDSIAPLPFREALYREYSARRRVVRFGEGDYLEAEPDQPTDAPRIEFPEFLRGLRSRVATALGVDEAEFVHGLVSEYAPGTPIGWHRDAPHFEIVAGVSLNSACRMRFRPFEDLRREAILTLDLQPRSLYLLRNDIRWRWQHSIPPVKDTRYSITLRTLVAGPPNVRRAGFPPTRPAAAPA